LLLALLLSMLAGPPAAAAPAPQLSLVAAAASVTIDRFPDEPVFLDLGINMVAGSRPFEIRVKPASYP
jgi:hypothetical protein